MKKISSKPLQKRIIENSISKNTTDKEIITKKNKDMNTKEKVNLANEILNGAKPSVKKLKKDKGLIERVENEKIILTEDNKELLKD